MLSPQNDFGLIIDNQTPYLIQFSPRALLPSPRASFQRLPTDILARAGVCYRIECSGRCGGGRVGRGCKGGKNERRGSKAAMPQALYEMPRERSETERAGVRKKQVSCMLRLRQ